MAKRGGESELRMGRDRLRDRVLASFDGFEPRTAVEVARGLGISTTGARDCLEELADAGELASKTVGDERIWYRTPSGSGSESGSTRAEAPAPAAIDERIDAAVADLSVPGTSELMRSWRRDAVRAAVEHLRSASPATGEEVVRSAYPGQRAGYDDPDAWWAMVRDRLAGLPGVVEGEDEWRFDPRAVGGQ